MVYRLNVAAFVGSVIVGVLVPYLLQLVIDFLIVWNGLYASIPMLGKTFFGEVANNRWVILVATVAVICLSQSRSL
jgi:hypothetical protein